jgi:Heparinase II/III-like protein/Heparinase II/III N-terminus
MFWPFQGPTLNSCDYLAILENDLKSRNNSLFLRERFAAESMPDQVRIPEHTRQGATTRISPVISVWHKARPHIAEMTWHELLTRARQEVRKRFDFVKYRAGLPAKLDGWNNRPPTGRTFLFLPEHLPDMTVLMREHMGGEVEKIITEANKICCHSFQLLGYDNLDYGAEIDWHLDAAHEKRAPLEPWFKIPFLNLSVVGDHKVTWELNRHQHLVTLAKAWALTYDEKYTSELIAQWYSWQIANPYPVGINWGSSLEVAFRSLSWLWARRLLTGCSAVPANFEADLLRALALNGSHIENYLSTYFSPNTHLIGEAVGLFFIGMLCPQIPAAARWRSCGWRIILQEAERQVRRDGVYFEQSLYYHVYALDFFLHARTLAARNEIEIPKSFDAILGRMLDVLQAVSQAGPPDSFGDDDGGRVFNPRRNRAEHLTDPLAIGAILFDRDDLRSRVSLTEEALWLFGQQAVLGFTQKSTRQPLKPASFEAGGIYVMAGSETCPQQLVIDAGPMGAERSGHGHADVLSVTVSFDGRRWLIDPGTFSYVATDNDRERFRGTGGHNTLRVDGLDQAVPEGPFAWSSLPAVSAERWTLGTSFSMFAGSHTGYSRLPDPVLHRRCVFHLRGAFWLVRDFAYGRERHCLEAMWHFAPDLQIRESEGAFVARPPERDDGSNVRLVLVPAKEPAWTHEVGWDEVSPVYGRKQPGQVLRITADVVLPAECATLIAPLLHKSDQPGRLSRLTEDKADASGAVRGYRYEEQGRVHYMIFAAGRESWELGPWTSDAEFVYCGIRDGELVQFILCGGSYARLNERSVVAHTCKIAHLEWLSQGGTSRIYASEHAATFSFPQDVVETLVFALW